MPTWDTYEDLKKALDLYVAANPEFSYVLVMAQANNDATRAVSKGAGNMSSAVAVSAVDEALTELMTFAAIANGVDGFEDFVDDGPDIDPDDDLPD